MKKKVHVLLLVFILALAPKMAAQEKASDPDIDLKMELYQKYKKEVVDYNKKKFDDLFFDFFAKMDDENTTLTKEEYYSYTIKIAIYNERLGLLYKDRKAEAQESKDKWFSKKYQDYLSSK